MWPVSARFAEAVSGSHRAVSRVRVLSDTQFTATPVGGTELPLLAGDVDLTATADVKATIDVTVPGDYWDDVQPYGAELFAERGVDFGDGTAEYVPLGYYLIEEIGQAAAPYGPIRITGGDRIVQMMQNRVLFPYQVPDGTSHRTIFERLVNGRPLDGLPSTLGYGMYIRAVVPIVWTGYDPDAATVPGGQVVEDSTYEFLAKIADDRGCVLRFDPIGRLVIERRDIDPETPPTYAIRGGQTGTLVRAARSVSRRGVYNIVTAYGSDPAAPTGYQVAYNNDLTSPLYWAGAFGAAPRYYASPVLRDAAGALAAARTVLSRSTGLPTTLSLFTVPNPAVRPLDVIEATVGIDVSTHVLDAVTIPLVGDEPVTIRTRTLNLLGSVQDQPDPVPTPDPDPDPVDPPPTTPPVGGGTNDPGDGTQAAVALGWGPVVDGDEFAYTGAPGAKWGMYDGPGHDNNGLRRPSAFSVANGILTCTGDNVAGGTTGGMAFRREEKYCRLEWRMRTYSINPSAPGNRYHPVLLMWPTDNDWPRGAEYDFVELDCDSGKLEAYLHLPNHQPYRQEYVNGGPLDIQNWHNYAFEWSPQGIAGWVDGRQYFRFTNPNIQAPGPMHATIQLDNFFGNNMCPARMEAQWVRYYRNPAA